MSAAFTPRLRTELSRERDALRMLHPWISLNNHIPTPHTPFPANDQPHQEPAACQDTALTAFAQLCALRLATRRVLITIISSTVEYVLAEATKSMSLQSDAVEDTRDQRWLGTCSFARGDGLNDLAIDGWRKARRLRESPHDKEHYYTSGKSSHYMIISDVREVPEAAERIFAKRATALRFYLSIPIRDIHGSVVGSLSIMDDKPRYGVSASDMLFCEDMSDTISQHLQNSIIRAQRQRSERLIQALSAFNGSRGSLRDWWLRQDNSTARRGGRHTSTSLEVAEQKGRLDEDFGVQESNFDQSIDASEAIGATTQHDKPGAADQENGLTADERTEEGIAGKDFDTRPNVGSEPSRNVHANGMYGPSSITSSQYRGARPSRQAAGGTSRKQPERENFDLAELTKQTYARASNLLREALGAEGVVFLNATGNAKPRSSESKSSHSSTSGSSSDSRRIAGSDNESSDTSTRVSRPCRLAGFSTRTTSTLVGTRSLAFELSDRDMSRLIKAYPSGKVFSFEDSGGVYSSSSESALSGGSGGSGVGSDGLKPQVKTRHSRHASLLRKVMGEARSIVFYPITNASGERWQSCAFLWTNNPARMFEADEDLTYLSAFAHSLGAELGRLETAVSDHAKGTFISSVSHELRSPLHGILAGVELVQGSQLTGFQEEMVHGIYLAGRTLLDTVNHVLDYSKISNLTHSQKRDRNKIDAARHQSRNLGLESEDVENIDIARLTEEVVESAVSAYRYESLFSQSHRSSRGATLPEQLLSGTGRSDNVSVVLDIRKQHSWVAPVLPGAWTRIVTNVLGNALKYTKAGTITVRLFTNISDDSDHHEGFVTFSVEDTGIGMSEDFVEHQLFTAFKQADSHAVGTGLGLSIVKEIAKELNAAIDVSSEIGIGTKVKVNLKAKFVKTMASKEDLDMSLHDSARQYLQRLCVLDIKESPQYTESTAAKAVVDSICQTASDWLGCDILLGRGRPTGSPVDVYLFYESDLLLLQDTDPATFKTLMYKIAREGTKLLVIGSSVASTGTLMAFHDIPIQPGFLQQPVGPRKLVRMISNTQTSHRARQLDGSTPRHETSPSHTASITMQGGPRESGSNNDSGSSYPPLPLVESGSKTDDLPMLSGGSMPSPSPSPSLKEAATKSMQSEETGQKPGRAVLLVEDNHVNMKFLVALMEKQNLPYESASDGLEAFEKYKSAPLDIFLVLMDMNMPIMDGFESTRKIREFERKRKIRNTTIAALTGVTTSEARDRAMDAGIDEFLTKPARMKDVTALVAKSRNGQGA